jgi:phospholipid transport system substrate-binding protein
MTIRSRRGVLCGAALTAVTLAYRPTGAAWAQSAARPDDAATVIQQLNAALLATMHAGGTASFSSRVDTLAPVIDRVFDLEAILKESVGIQWDSMPADARARLLRVYRTFSIVTYVANFDKYDGETFNILPAGRTVGNDRIVASELIGAHGDHTRLDYLMRDEHGMWRGVDVLVDGSISRVAAQRSDFRKVLRTGDTEALIAMLQKKIANLSGGALGS